MGAKNGLRGAARCFVIGTEIFIKGLVPSGLEERSVHLIEDACAKKYLRSLAA